MRPYFRQLAKLSTARARQELSSGDSDRLKYAALELRMAMEGLTYDRAYAYRQEIPPSEYNTWQPRKLMQLLLEIDPTADSDSTIAIGLESEPGKQAPVMHALGHENVLNLTVLKEHYDALGSFLHLPSLRQMEKREEEDPLRRMRARCEQVTAEVERALESTVYNSTLGSFATHNCLRCDHAVRKRIPRGIEKVDAKCFQCGAEYVVSEAGPDQCYWRPVQEEIKCRSEGCSELFVLWRDEITQGTWWTCPQCKRSYRIALAILPHDARGAGSTA